MRFDLSQENCFEKPPGLLTARTIYDSSLLERVNRAWNEMFPARHERQLLKFEKKLKAQLTELTDDWIFGNEVELNSGELYEILNFKQHRSFWNARVFSKTDTDNNQPLELVSLKTFYGFDYTHDNTKSIRYLLYLGIEEVAMGSLGDKIKSKYILKFLYKDKCFHVPAKYFLSAINDTIKRKMLIYERLENNFDCDLTMDKFDWINKYHEIRNMKDKTNLSDNFKKVWSSQAWVY